jgi:hypothetical protein
MLSQSPRFCSLLARGAARPLSSSAPVYEGRYWRSLRRIRRVSLGSCVTGLVVVPLGLWEHADTLSQAGQMAIMGVTLLTCVGSTVGLHYLSHTYVANMTGAEGAVSVQRIGMLGNLLPREVVHFNDIVKSNAFQHPFSNFKANNGKFYYVSIPAITDEKIREEFDKKLA